MPIDPCQSQALATSFSWTSLPGQAAVAAIVSGGFLWFTNSRRLGLDRELTQQKINSDQALAKQKFEFDKELAQHRFDLDMRLLERKTKLEQAQIAWRRRYELAEQILQAAYEARDALKWARARVVLKGEGESRKTNEKENEQVRSARNSAFVPIERLTEHAKAFATLQTAQDSAAAHFGPEAVQAITSLLSEHRKITVACSHLIQLADWGEDREGSSALFPFRDELWGDGVGKADTAIDCSVNKLEEICRPTLLVAMPS